MTELAKLVEVGGATPPDKILDQAAALRKADLDEFLTPVTGEKALALAALAAAKAQTDETTAFNPAGLPSADNAW